MQHLFRRQHTVQFEVVWPETMDEFAVAARIAGAAIAALSLAAFEFGQRAIQTHLEDIKRLEQVDQAIELSRRLDDMVDDDVVAGGSKCRQTSVKAFKHHWSHGIP